MVTEPLEMQGGTTFTFVADGLASAAEVVASPTVTHVTYRAVG